MNNTIRVIYVLIDVPSRSFSKIVPYSVRCEDFLEIFSIKSGKTYTALFYEGAEIDPDGTLFDYWEPGPDCIFIASSNSEIIPPDDFH